VKSEKVEYYQSSVAFLERRKEELKKREQVVTTFRNIDGSKEVEKS
jgi:hypothetical protein